MTNLDWKKEMVVPHLYMETGISLSFPNSQAISNVKQGFDDSSIGFSVQTCIENRPKIVNFGNQET